MTDWLPGAERDEQGGGVTLDRSLPPRAVWHITWDALSEDGSQPDFDAVANYLKRMAYCPHLMWDPWTGRVVQFYPASVGGRALNAWNEDGSANIQIEVFFSPGAVRDGKRYDTVAETPCVGLDKILAWLDGFGIPRVWPMGAPQWQGNSRDADVWNANAGHYGHCNVPDNTHTDPGPMPSLAITNAGGETQPIDRKDWLDVNIETLKKILLSLVWGYKNPKLERDDAYALLRATRTYSVNNAKQIAELTGTVKALAGAVQSLGKGQTIDYARLEAAAKSGAEEAFKQGVDVNVTVGGTDV